jgi:hypothetical protein
MQLTVKHAISAALLGTAALAGTAAHAAAALPSTGNGSLIFFITDTKTNVTYADVLTQNINDLFSKTQATTPAPTGSLNTITGDAGFSVDLSTDGNLTAFLATAGSDTLNWGVISGGVTGVSTAQKQPIGNVRILTTSSSSNAVLTSVAVSSLLGGVVSGLGTDVGALNTNLGANNSVASGGIFGEAASANGTNLSLYGAGVDQSGLTVGGTYTLFGLSGNGNSSGSAYGYNVGTVKFASDVLTFTGNPSAVPLPAAVWLLGSGLLGLAGVGRRRKVAA